MSSSRKNNKLKEKRYAHAYARELQSLLIATQIRVLREQRGLTQAQLANLCGMKQARISLMESGSYSQWTLSTLRALAEAFDVGLDVRFMSFCELLDRMENSTRTALEVESRQAELGQPQTTAASTIFVSRVSLGNITSWSADWQTTAGEVADQHALVAH